MADKSRQCTVSVDCLLQLHPHPRYLTECAGNSLIRRKMKRKTIAFYFYKALTTFVFAIWLVVTSACHRDPTGLKTAGFIAVDSLHDNAILVRFGYDAVVAVATKRGIVVIDAGIATGLTQKFREVIEKEFGRNDFVYLINTHGHSDHTGGNAVFSDAVIIGHEHCLEEIPDGWKDPEKIKSGLQKIIQQSAVEMLASKPGSGAWKAAYCQKERYQFALNDVTGNRVITKPDVTFNDRLSISLGDATVNLVYFGKAHSGSDIIIYIPEMKLLMTGDLFFPGGIPSGRDFGKNDVERWRSTMKWIMDRRHKIEKVIGGHGQVMSPGDLDAFNDYTLRKWEEFNR